MNSIRLYHEITPEQRAQFVRIGYPGPYFFPHQIYYVPRAGPDAAKVATRSGFGLEPDALWEILLYAAPPVLDEFPDALYFDNDIVWHQQHLQKRGLIATANALIQNNAVYSNNHLSDLVQRISRRREYKTRIENRFKGWHHLLLNALVSFALTLQLETVFVPSAEQVLSLADPARRKTIQPELFQRAYDNAVNARLDAHLENGWWKIPAAPNAARVILPRPRQEVTPPAPQKIICVCHDIERGLGHGATDRKLAHIANRNSPAAVTRMLAIEKELEIQATYNVVGILMQETRAGIERGRHCLAFHSYNHTVPGGMSKPGLHWNWARRLFLTARQPTPLDQLAHCREIDYRLKGYRAPQSNLSPNLGERHLLYHNFEWLASSANSFGFTIPRLENRIVKIPILFDDYPLYSRAMTYEQWETDALEKIAAHDFVAFGLHDCYAHLWLSHYPNFLKKIRALGTFQTLDQVAANTFLAHAI